MATGEKEALRRIQKAKKNKSKFLDLSNLRLKSIPQELWYLTNLSTLYLQDNQLTSISTEIGNLTNLTRLNLVVNQITSIPKEIGNLINLTHLHLGGNKLTSIPEEIGNLTNLTYLGLGGNQLTSIPETIVNLTNLIYLDLQNNPHLKIPPEILVDNVSKKPNNPQVIFEYLKKAKTDVLNEVKLLLVGQGAVGKTSLRKRLMRKRFNINETTTPGFEKVHELKLKLYDEWFIDLWNKIKKHDPKSDDITETLSSKQGSITYNVWDFGGQDIYKATHKFFLTERSIYILVWDGREGTETSKVKYWLETIKTIAGNECPIFIVMNKMEFQSEDPESFFEEIKNKYSQVYPEHFKISCKQNQGIRELFKEIRNHARSMPHLREVWPLS